MSGCATGDHTNSFIMPLSHALHYCIMHFYFIDSFIDLFIDLFIDSLIDSSIARNVE